MYFFFAITNLANIYQIEKINGYLMENILHMQYNCAKQIKIYLFAYNIFKSVNLKNSLMSFYFYFIDVFN